MSLAISDTCRSNFLLTVTVLGACYQAYQLVIPYRPILTGHQLTADTSHRGSIWVYTLLYTVTGIQLYICFGHSTRPTATAFAFSSEHYSWIILSCAWFCSDIVKLCYNLSWPSRSIHRLPSHLLLLSCTNHAMFSVSLDRIPFVLSPSWWTFPLPYPYISPSAHEESPFSVQTIRYKNHAGKAWGCHKYW